MRITIEPTSKIVDIQTSSGAWVPARIWEGKTERGTPVHCFITRICPTVPNPAAPIVEEFQAALIETKPPSPAVDAIPLRFVL